MRSILLVCLLYPKIVKRYFNRLLMKAQTPYGLGFFNALDSTLGLIAFMKKENCRERRGKRYSISSVIVYENDCAYLTKWKAVKMFWRKLSGYCMWIIHFRVSDTYQMVLFLTRGKYENQTSGNVLWKREEMSKRQSNKTGKTKLTLVILILSYP